MNARPVTPRRIGWVVLAAAILLASTASAFDADQTFRKGSFVLSAEGNYGEQWNPEDHGFWTQLNFWNVGLRASILPFGNAGPGFIRGAFEVGLEPLFQRYIHPNGEYWAGMMLLFRYHFTALGRVVPYLEIGGGPGVTDLNVREISSDMSFMLWGGVGVSVFVNDRTAIYVGYRYEHNSNGGTDTPNRGWEANVAVIGVSYYLR